jgi:hypothetical protein
VFRLAAPPRPPAPPAARQVAGWILRDPARLDPGEHAQLTALRGCCPEIDALTGHVAAFAAILTGRHGDRLGAWLAAVDASPAQPDLHSFTAGIRQDHDAVRNGLTLPWNSGRIEGLNTRTKLLSSSRGRFSPRLSRNRT